MKKFYAIALAAAVAVSASATGFQKANTSIRAIEVDNLQKLENVAKTNFTVVAKDENAVKPLASNYPVDPVGKYLMCSSFSTYEGTYLANEFQVVEDQPLGQGYFTINNLFTWFDDDINAMADLVTLNYNDGSTGYGLYVDPYPIYDDQYSLLVIGYMDGGFMLIDKEVLFTLDDETGAIQMPKYTFNPGYETMQVGLGLINSANRGYFFPDMTFYAANGTFSWQEYSGGTYSPMEYNVYGFQSGDQLSLLNFADTPYEMIVDLDLENGEIAVIDQLAAGTPLWSYDFDWCTVLDGNIYYDMYGTIENNEDGKTSTLEIPFEVLAISEAGYYARGKNVVINFDFPISGLAGVNNVVVGEDANAPVEYYNLQGVRVANPAAGTLVIKKQGNTVTKTLVR